MYMTLIACGIPNIVKRMLEVDHFPTPLYTTVRVILSRKFMDFIQNL